MPHISDFFTYVDMEEGYPFTGTGNMINFVKGLISISIQNNIIVIFDNDAEGVDTYSRCMKLNIPHNMQILKLPYLSEFEDFNTVGPIGESRTNINGKAVGIECFLDVGTNSIIRWNNYNKGLKIYQGELEEKDQFKREFLSQNVKTENYDYSKLQQLLSLLFDTAVSIKENELLKSLS